MGPRLSTIRLFLIFGVCAVILGYVVASPLSRATLGVYGLILFVLAIPFLLRWHHVWLIAAWNTNAIVFLMPGRPPFWLLMVALSLLISVGSFALIDRKKYLFAPTVFRPLLFLAFVIVATTAIKGDFGIGAFGGEASGGKKTLFLLGAILGFFALTARSISREHGSLYAAIFFLGGGTAAIGNLLPIINPAFYFIFAIFAPEQSGFEALGLIEASEVVRFGGLTAASTAIFCALLCNYGIEGTIGLKDRFYLLPFKFQGGFGINQPWRLLIFISILGLSLFGGFRSAIVIFGLTLGVLFCYERLFRTRLFPKLLLVGALGVIILIPTASSLPLGMQRAISFLPLDVDLMAKSSAEGSTEWRLRIWERLLPEVPRYFFIGKGYGISSREISILADAESRGQGDSAEIALLAGDYHSGPLSVIIPFGIFGVIGFLWFLFSGGKVLMQNYRFGASSLRTINRFLLAYFIARAIHFFLVFGSLYSDLFFFTGLVGLSVSLNNGVKVPLRRNISVVEEQGAVDR